MDTVIRYKILKCNNRFLKVEVSRRGTGNGQGSDRLKKEVVGDRKVIGVVPVPVNVGDAPETEAERLSGSLN